MQVNTHLHPINVYPVRYFEQRLRVAEESYREERALLQLRLVEGALEDSVLKTQDARYANASRPRSANLPTSRQLHTIYKPGPVVGHLTDRCRVCVCSFLSEGRGEEERTDVLAEITLKLEKHQEAFDQLRIQLEERHTQELSNQRSSMALSYREELLQVHTHQGFTVNL